MAFEMSNKIQSREHSRDGDEGDISHNSDGDPNLLNVSRNDDDPWLNTTYDNPDNQWNRDNGFAFVVSKFSLFFSPYFLLGEFFFNRLPFQPPKSLPTEFNFSESWMYLLSSKDFVSQRICKNIFKTSALRIANWT